VRRYQAGCPYIELVHHDCGGPRHPGSRVIHAFNRGYERVKAVEYDFIVKLDCDLSFAPDYFEQLLARFTADTGLGIASGVYLEEDKAANWQPVKMPAYHAFGACKVARRRCFEAINGFITSPGWDTVDEIRAWNTGWRTRHFDDLLVRHHKPEGLGIGRIRTSRMHGEIFYRTGGDPVFLLFKIVHRMTVAPFLIGALALTFGYLEALFTRQPILVTKREARAYRKVLRRRLIGRSAQGLSLEPVYARR
jgi:hypothetical protein